MKIQILAAALILGCSINMMSQDLKSAGIDTESYPRAVSGNTFIITGKGGNIAVHVGRNEVLMVDDQFEAGAEKILERVMKLGDDKPIKFLINTHHHGDHTGGNEKMAEAGATIIAHENARQLLRKGKKVKEEALPVLTFDKSMKLHFDNEEIYAFHVPNAHTSGDVMVYFPQTSVLHTGDAFVNGMYPYIDEANGGTLKGYIKGLKNIAMLDNKNLKIIPGHGPVANMADINLTVFMLQTIGKRIKVEISRKKTEDEVAANTTLTEDYDAKGYGDGFINGEKIRRSIYRALTNAYENEKEEAMRKKMGGKLKTKNGGADKN